MEGDLDQRHGTYSACTVFLPVKYFVSIDVMYLKSSRRPVIDLSDVTARRPGEEFPAAGPAGQRACARQASGFGARPARCSSIATGVDQYLTKI